MEDNIALETRYGHFLAAAGSQKGIAIGCCVAVLLLLLFLLLLLLLCAAHRGIPLCKATALLQ